MRCGDCRPCSSRCVRRECVRLRVHLEVLCSSPAALLTRAACTTNTTTTTTNKHTTKQDEQRRIEAERREAERARHKDEREKEKELELIRKQYLVSYFTCYFIGTHLNLEGVRQGV